MTWRPNVAVFGTTASDPPHAGMQKQRGWMSAPTCGCNITHLSSGTKVREIWHAWLSGADSVTRQAVSHAEITH